MEEGERIMGMEIRPVYAGESMAWLVTSTDNTPEVWTLNNGALIRSVRPVPCGKCGYLPAVWPRACRRSRPHACRMIPMSRNHGRRRRSGRSMVRTTGRVRRRARWFPLVSRSSCFPFAWLVMVVFPGGRFSQRTSFCLARCTGRLWCHPRQASRRDAACRARRDNGSHRSRRRACL